MDLTFFAPINVLGYGQVGKNLLINLAKQNRVAFFPIGPINCESEHHSVIRECLDNAKTYNYDATCLCVWHQHDLYKRIGRGDFIGFPFLH